MIPSNMASEINFTQQPGFLSFEYIKVDTLATTPPFWRRNVNQAKEVFRHRGVVKRLLHFCNIDPLTPTGRILPDISINSAGT